MADLSNPLTQVAVAQAQPAVTVNNLVDAMSPAALYGQNDLTTTGLTWGYYGGRFRGISVAHGTIALPASEASVYIVAAVATGVVSQSTSTTNWNNSTDYMRLYLATTGSSTITDWDDYREWLASAGAGVATVDTETIQDVVASLLTAGTNITVQYNDGDSPATFVINAASGAVPLTQEQVEDIVADYISISGGSKQYNDGDSPATLVLTAPAAPALDADLTTIAGLTATSDNFMQAKSSAWASRTVAQVSTDLQATGLVTDAVGFRTVPQNSQSTAYTTVAADSGKHILHPTADNNARIFTIDSNANVAYPVGTLITIVNQINTITIAITTDTLTWLPDGTTGSRTLAANGLANLLKIASTTWVITGVGIT